MIWTWKHNFSSSSSFLSDKEMKSKGRDEDTHGSSKMELLALLIHLGCFDMTTSPWILTYTQWSNQFLVPINWSCKTEEKSSAIRVTEEWIPRVQWIDDGNLASNLQASVLKGCWRWASLHLGSNSWPFSSFTFMYLLILAPLQQQPLHSINLQKFKYPRKKYKEVCF